jgi:hypothetical protein
MDQKRRVLVVPATEKVSGGDETTATTLDLLVVCHGMFLFEVAKDERGDHQLFAHAPVVPAMPGKNGMEGDPGHVYLVNGKRSAYGAEPLGDTGNMYELVGPKPLLITHMAPDLAGSTTTWHSDSNLVLPSGTYTRSAEKAAYTVVMPLPDDYWGWRSTSPVRNLKGASLSSPYTAAAPVRPVLPWSVFSTHVFRFTGGASLALNRKGETTPFWPNDGSSPAVLHLFSQPESLEDALRLARSGVKMDHMEHLNELVDPDPEVASAPAGQLAEMEQPRVPWGLQRDDLLDLGELSTTDPARVLGKAVRPPDRTVGGVKVACGAYFLNNSSQTEQ